MKLKYFYFFAFLILFYPLNINASTLDSYEVFNAQDYVSKNYESGVFYSGYKFDDLKFYSDHMADIKKLEDFALSTFDNFEKSCPFYFSSLMYTDTMNYNGDSSVQTSAFILSYQCFESIPKLRLRDYSEQIYSTYKFIYYNDKKYLVTVGPERYPSIIDYHNFRAYELTDKVVYFPSFYYDSNFDLYLDSDYIYEEKTSPGVGSDAPNLLGNSVNSVVYSGDILVSSTKFLTTYKSKILGKLDENLVDVHLSDYGMVLLVPKFNTVGKYPFYYKGKVCIDSIYNYGTSEHSSVDTRCLPNYQDYEASYFYVVSNDVKNNAVYYFTSYDKNIDTYFKYDSRYFNAYYYTDEEFANNPKLTIGNTTYDIKNSSALSKDVSDLCLIENGCSSSDHFELDNWDHSFKDFPSILNFLKDSIVSFTSSISSIFTLVVTFISSLPVVMQSTIYIFFTTGFILILIKILL